MIAICDNGRDEGSKNLKILRTSFKYRPSIIINNLLPAELTKITEEEMLSFCPFSSRCTTYLAHIEICVIIQLAVRKGASATFWSPGCYFLIPGIWCLALLGQIQDSLCSLNLALLMKNIPYFPCPILLPGSACFSCCFMVLRTTTHSARQNHWTPKTSTSTNVDHYSVLLGHCL